MIPFLDLKAQYSQTGQAIENAVIDVLRSGDYVLGRAVGDFESDFASFCGARSAVALNTGTSALQLALLAAGIGPGDEVVTTPATFVATVAAILYVGARPIFVDIDPMTWTLDPSKLRRVITSRTKAIIPVHLHGRLTDMSAIMAVAGHHGIAVIEDAAQAHGAERDGLRAGTIGDVGCYSFYPGKNLGACGEGGAIVTNDAALADRVRRLRDWGQDGKYNHVVRGFNFRMDTVQAAILGVKLRYLEDWTMARRRIAGLYDHLLDEIGVERPPSGGLAHAYHVYAVRVENRDEIQRRMQRLGVATGIHYPRPVHLQPAYADLGYKLGDLPVAERLALETLSLPIYPEMTTSHVEQVVAALAEAGAVPVDVIAGTAA